ncbi:hypothetical protein O9993_18180 [Vibrio lentus]|nr:hypothetical protein [Vibrio lentus]
MYWGGVILGASLRLTATMALRFSLPFTFWHGTNVSPRDVNCVYIGGYFTVVQLPQYC